MLSDYYSKGASDLDSWRADIDVWTKHELEDATSEVRQQYYKEIQGLESKCSAAEIALQACKFIEDENDEKRSELEKRLDDLRQAMAAFRKKYHL